MSPEQSQKPPAPLGGGLVIALETYKGLLAMQEKLTCKSKVASLEGLDS